MFSNNFIDNLLEALADERIKQKIIDIIDKKNDVVRIVSDGVLGEKEGEIKTDGKVFELENLLNEEKKDKELLLEDIKSYKNKINDLKNELEIKDNVISKLELDLGSWKDKYSSQQQKLDYEKNEVEKLNKMYNLILEETKQLKENLAYYDNTYKILSSCYETFKKLRNDIHSELSKVINIENSEMFLCSGVQWDNIEALWSFISYKLNEYDENEIKVLIDTFNYFFERYNQIHGLYSLLDVNINDEFDEDLHTRASNSRVTGKISKVLLNGYKNIRTNKIVQKSIVGV